jgi:ABC-type hemin transport system substrate-binding protein
VPSQTELLYHLGLGDRVVGITKFCIHPRQWAQSKTVIGGTKNFWFDVIDQLQPDLIIGNKEENYQEGIRQLEQQHPVWVSDILDITQAYDMMHAVGDITDTRAEADNIVRSIKLAFQNLTVFKPVSTLYLIWKNPWMAAGKNTFIDTLLLRLGLVNAVAESRYPELTPEAIQTLQPSVVMLSSEPFPFAEKHIAEIQQLLPSSRIILVDGEMFSWYGSRLLQAPGYFATLPIERQS